MGMRVALIHYWLVGMRGGEKVLEALCRLFPDADIFTHVYDPSAVSETISSHKIQTTFINKLPNARRLYKRYFPLMPLALEQIDLRGYDLIISSESGPAKGIIPPAGAVHICYCHSPMRYIWNMFHDYREKAGPLTKVVMPVLSHYIRTWDAVASMRVNHFVANSHCVAARLDSYYRREAQVIHPPVNIDSFQLVSDNEIGDFYLMAGELVGYKRPELAIETFNRLKLPLIVIGSGEKFDSLKKIAAPNVKMLGSQPFDVLRDHYSRCRALIFPGEEDFGIVPVEVMASGRPVIAYGRGGATETVTDGISGIFFEEQTIGSLSNAIRRFEQLKFDGRLIRESVKKFNSERFEREFMSFLQSHISAPLFENLHQSRSLPALTLTSGQSSEVRAANTVPQAI